MSEVSFGRLSSVFADQLKTSKFVFAWDSGLQVANVFFTILALLISAYYYYAKVNCFIISGINNNIIGRADYIETWCSLHHVNVHIVAYSLWVQILLFFLPYSLFYLVHGDRIRSLCDAIKM